MYFLWVIMVSHTLLDLENDKLLDAFSSGLILLLLEPQHEGSVLSFKIDT